jgi:hypothetical protein
VSWGKGSGALAIALAAIAIPAASGGAQTGGGSAGGECTPNLTIVADSQSDLIRAKAVRAVLDQSDCETGLAGKLHAYLRSRGKKRSVGKSQRTELGGAFTAELRLGGKDRRRVKKCRRQKLVVTFAGDGVKAEDSARLERDLRRCQGGSAGGPGGGSGGGGGGGDRPAEPAGFSTADAARCDFLDRSVCLHPFPNDHFTVGDSATATGRRVNLNLQSMPRSRQGIPISPEDQNRADGFSPGNMIITKVPGLDTQAAFRRTGAVPITDIARFADPNQPVVVINARTGERHPIWSEIDANPTDPDDVNLLIRPAVNFDEGERYIVALRRMRKANGDVIPAQRGFELYRDRIRTQPRDEAIESRRPHFERIFDKLAASGIERDNLFLAWDFTVASERNLSERALSIRDDAFEQLGDPNLADMQVQGSSPQYVITRTVDYAKCGSDGNPDCEEPNPITGTGGESNEIARRIEGQMVVPCYLDTPGCAQGGQFRFAPGSNIPIRIPGNTALSNFICQIPHAAVDGPANASRPGLYGHGLLGDSTQVNEGGVRQMSQAHNFTFCATDWAGFSTKDAPTIAQILQELSAFPKLADHSQQGFLNFMYLGRAMIHPQGFQDDAQFRPGGKDVIDESRLYYDGNSQGGILGGALTALAPDFDRAVLGVPGMNYSTLLRRSVDFDGYANGDLFGPDTPIGLYDNYPSELERPLVLSLIQMLWDRGEANGYAHHMTSDPLADTPPHEALLHVALGDHQVAQVTADVEARTIGGATMPRPVANGRHAEVEPLWGIPRISSLPYAGSALVYWDSGSPVPPTTNVPPREGEDPHGHPRREPSAILQKSEFLKPGGRVVDVCGGGPCFARGFSVP